MFTRLLSKAQGLFSRLALAGAFAFTVGVARVEAVKFDGLTFSPLAACDDGCPYVPNRDEAANPDSTSM